MTAFCDLIGTAEEFHVSGQVAVKHSAFIRLGLTDAALLEAGDPSSVVLTDDFDLYAAADRAGRQVLNFNHAREANR